MSGSTKTVGRLAQRWLHQLGHLMTPNNRNSIGALLSTGLPWAADNGAFKGFDPERFRRFLRKLHGRERCLFVVAPDVVADARATLGLFWQWRDEVALSGQPIAFVGQDGAEDVEVPWWSFDAWFIGGTTEWKLSGTSAQMAVEAKRRGKHVHMGRVNSFKRMLIAFEMGCDSVDGSSASMFGDKYIHKFCAFNDQLARQKVLFAKVRP